MHCRIALFYVKKLKKLEEICNNLLTNHAMRGIIYTDRKKGGRQYGRHNKSLARLGKGG